jgi:hypothetical protein
MCALQALHAVHHSSAEHWVPHRTASTQARLPAAERTCPVVSSDHAAEQTACLVQDLLRCIATGLDGGATPSGVRFPPAFPEAAAGEARDCRRARLEAYTACSAALRSSVEVWHPERIADVPSPLQLCINHLCMYHRAEHAAAPRPMAWRLA